MATELAIATTPPPQTETPGSSLELAHATERALANQGNNVRASWRFSLDHVRANIQYLSPDAKELLVWAFKWCIDPAHSIHFSTFCERVGYSTNTVWKLYSAKYKHPETDPAKPNFGKLMDAPEKLLKAIRDFRRLELARARMGAKKFIHTPTAKRIYWAIDQARKSGRPVMLWGGSHIGKTEACRENAVEFNHGKTVLVEIEAVNGLRGLLQEIAHKLGISPNSATPELIKRIKAALTSDMVLILDEVHLLANVYRKGSFFACMEEIRRLWDAKKFGLVFTYTDLGYERAEVERKRELLQVFRRATLKVNLGPCPTLEDVRAIVESFGLDWSEAYDVIEVAKDVSDAPVKALKQLAAEEGLASIFERLRMAHELASDDEREEINWADWIKAHFAIKGQALRPATGWEKVA